MRAEPSDDRRHGLIWRVRRGLLSVAAPLALLPLGWPTTWWWGRPIRPAEALAAESARFYESLHARFNLVFNDVTDRDAGYYQYVEGNPHTWWGPADFAGLNRYLAGFTRRTRARVVLWELPLGNTMLPNTWGR